MEIPGAQAAYRVLDVLNEVALNPNSVSAADVARAVSLTVPTAHRLLRVLCDRGFVVQDGAGGKYRLGPQLQVLIGDGINPASLAELARPLLVQLRDETDETVFMSVRDGLQVSYLECHSSSHSVQMYGAPGMKVPLHATSQGKVILAFLPPGVGERLITQLDFERYTDNTVTDAEKLINIVSEVRERGYAINLEEREMGVRSVSAPVLNSAGNVVAAVCVGGPIFRLSIDDLNGRLSNLTRATAEVISQRLAEGPLPHEELLAGTDGGVTR